MLEQENPYATPVAEPGPFAPTSSDIPKGSLFAAGFFTLAGTSLAGGLFGIIGCIFGVIVGFFIAAIVGTPVTVIVFAIFAWISPPMIPRSRVICVAATSGAITGFLSCWPLFFGLSPEGLAMSCTAAGVGAVGAALFVYLFLRTALTQQPMLPPPAVWNDLK